MLLPKLVLLHFLCTTDNQAKIQFSYAQYKIPWFSSEKPLYSVLKT